MIVIGTGLIGTSVALAARRKGVSVFLTDRDPGVARIAEALGAGTAGMPPRPVDLAVLAVPPSAIGGVLRESQLAGIASSYTDVAGVKGAPERAALSLAPDPGAYIGGHPMAGRERSGPLAAGADLFTGRPWVLTPSPRTGRSAVQRAEELVALCGGVPLRMSSRAHDDTVALTSHVPHLVASLVAARLGAGPDGASRLAGRGARDVTRIAAGDPGLWTDIVAANAPAIGGVLRDLHADLSGLLSAVEQVSGSDAAGRTAGRRALADLLERGVDGVARTWPAHGGPDRNEPGPRLSVRIDPRPGELSRLVSALTSLDRNAAVTGVEIVAGAMKVHIGCTPGASDRIAAGLRSAGWGITPFDVPVGSVGSFL